MDYVSTWMGDRLSALLVSLMALQLTLVDRNPFWLCSKFVTVRTQMIVDLTCYNVSPI